MRLNNLILLGIILITLGTALEFYPAPITKQKVQVNVIVNITPRVKKVRFKMQPYTVAIVNLDKHFLKKTLRIRVKANPDTMIFIAIYNKKNNTADIIRRVTSFDFNLYYANQTEKILIYSPVRQDVEIQVMQYGR